MHWTLDDLRAVDADEYDVLVEQMRELFKSREKKH